MLVPSTNGRNSQSSGRLKPESGILSRSPMWVAAAQVLGSFAAAFPGAVSGRSGSWIKCGVAMCWSSASRGYQLVSPVVAYLTMPQHRSLFPQCPNWSCVHSPKSLPCWGIEERWEKFQVPATILRRRKLECLSHKQLAQWLSWLSWSTARSQCVVLCFDFQPVIQRVISLLFVLEPYVNWHSLHSWGCWDAGLGFTSES